MSPRPPPVVRGARLLALALVLVALVDPAFRQETPEALEVVVLRGDGRDPGGDNDVARVRAALEGWAPEERWGRRPGGGPLVRAVPEGHPTARATVVVGSRIPSGPVVGPTWVASSPGAPARPALGVVRTPRIAGGTLLPLQLHFRDGSEAPDSLLAGAGLRVQVSALLLTSVSASGDPEGWPWIPLADTALTPGWASDSRQARNPLPVPSPLPVPDPWGAGGESSPRLLSVDVAGRPHALLLVEVDPEPRQLLFLEPRPTWPATFLRRGLEGDSRVRLHVRTDLAPGVRSRGGSPPASVAAPRALDPFHLVVVGAPEALAGEEREALDRWVRERGGSLLLLYAEGAGEAGGGAAPVDPWSALHGGGSLRERRMAEPVDLRPPSTERSASPARAGGLPGPASSALPGATPEPTSEPTPGLSPMLGPTSAAGSGAAPLRPPLRARTLIQPGALPGAARALLSAPDGTPAVWEVPRGEGLVVVSGAGDAWEHRDPEESGWEGFWSDLVTRAAHRTPPPLEARWAGEIPGPGGGVAAPGETVEVEVRLDHGYVRSGPDGAVPTPVELRIRRGSGPGPVASGDPVAPVSDPREGPPPSALREDPPASAPDPFPGAVDAGLLRFRAPLEEGRWWVEVRALPEGAPRAGGGAGREGAGPADEGAAGRGGEGEDEAGRVARLPLLVTGHAPPPLDDPAPLVRAWALAAGGRVLPHADLETLAAEILAALEPPMQSEPWHPMRNPWWILPLVLLLGVEWGWRRRRGLP